MSIFFDQPLGLFVQPDGRGLRDQCWASGLDCGEVRPGKSNCVLIWFQVTQSAEVLDDMVSLR